MSRPKAKRYNYDQDTFEVKAKIFNFKSFSGYLDAMQKAIDELSKIEGLKDAHFRSVKIKSEGMGEVCVQVELITSWGEAKAVKIAKELP